MFRKKPQAVGDLMLRVMRSEGLETPLLQKRVIDAWEEVAGKAVARYTQEKFIRNQTLCVRLSSPALRSDLTMMRTELVARLNRRVGSFVISDIRFI